MFRQIALEFLFVATDRRVIVEGDIEKWFYERHQRHVSIDMRTTIQGHSKERVLVTRPPRRARFLASTSNVLK